MARSRSRSGERSGRNRSVASAAAYAAEPLEARTLLAAQLNLSGLQTPTAGPTVNVSSNTTNYQSEMSVAVDPTNPLNIVGLSHTIPIAGGPIVLDVYYSTDGGLTWTANRIDNNDDGLGAAGNRFDPAIAFDDNGRLYIAYGVRGTAGPPATATRLVTAVSTNGGQTFANFQVLDTQNDPNGAGTSPPGVDRWTFATGTDGASSTQAAVLTYTQNVSEASGTDQRIVAVGTRDGGANWTTPLIINDGSINGTDAGNLGACPTIGLGGELSVAWYNGSNAIEFDTDRNGLWGTGFNFGTDRTIRSGTALGNITPPAQPQRGLRVSPVLASNIYNGDIYVTWHELLGSTGNDTDVWFGKSTDSGVNWTLRRVDVSTGTEFHPIMSVDGQSNAIGIAYYTTDGDQTTSNDDVRMRLAVSGDFGGTWAIANVSNQQSNETGGTPNDYLEYTGLSLRDGSAQVLWASRYPGGGTDLDAFTARVGFDSSTDGNRLRITGGGTLNNTFLIRRSPTNANYLEVFTDGVRDYTGMAVSVDAITIESGGNDTITIDDMSNIPITIEGSTGHDTYTITAINGVASLTINGGQGDDVVGLGNSLSAPGSIASPIIFNGWEGSDTLYVGSGNADAITADVTFNGRLPGPSSSIDRIIYNDQTVQYQVSYDVAPTVITRQGFFSPRTVTYSGTSRIIINAGADGDLINVRNSVGPVVEAHGNAGGDIFTRGVVNPGAGAIFNGGSGNNTITFDGTAENVNRLWDIFFDRVIYAGIVNFVTTGFESVAVLCGGGADTITFAGGNAVYSQSFTIDGGGGADSFNTNTARISSLTIQGGSGAGTDYLRIDDRNILANFDGTYYRTNEVARYRLPGQGGDPGINYSVVHSGLESIDYLPPNGQNWIEIFGTGAGVLQNSIFGNASTDYFFIYPHNGGGNLTINSTIYLLGGTTSGVTDNVYINDSTSFPLNLTFDNSFGSNYAAIAGMGTGRVNVFNDMENIFVNGGGGNDVVNLNTYQSGTALVVNSGGGDDRVNWTPQSNNLASISNMSFFSYDGGNESDSMYVYNGGSTVVANYIESGAQLSITGSTLLLAMPHPNVEFVSASGGSAADTFRVSATGPAVDFNGGNGNDIYNLGAASGTITLQNIRTRVKLNGAGGTDSINLNATGDTVGRTFHLTADSIGAFPGDNLFGPGGSVHFSSIAGSITVNLGPGGDTVYARPNETAAITINGNNPAAAPGDRLNLALAGADGYAINGTAASGNVSSTNLRTLAWNGFETGPAVDETAPAVVVADININGINGLTDGADRRQSLDVQFSEDVSALISTAWLELTNLTTNEPVPAANISVQYDAATNTAHFTFPGYPLGVLPDGNYSGRVLAGLPDFFGNGLPADAPFAFFFLQGDANRDGRVNLQDFNILAANFGQSDRTFSQGDFNYDGTVNLQDFNILASRFGAVLNGAQPSGSPFGGGRIGLGEQEERELMKELLS